MCPSRVPQRDTRGTFSQGIKREVILRGEIHTLMFVIAQYKTKIGIADFEASLKFELEGHRKGYTITQKLRMGLSNKSKGIKG